MRILCVETPKPDLDWSMRCQKAGHTVKWYLKADPKSDPVGKGIVDRVSDLWEWWKWADLIVYPDNTAWLGAAETFRAAGWPVVAATPTSAAWEINRKIGQKVFEKAGVPTLPSKAFSDYDAAIKHVEKSMGRFVSKPQGDAKDKALSYVSKSPEDMIYMLRRWKKAQTIVGEFVLQEFRGGVEMAVGGWFGPAGFMAGWCENFEFKKLMDNDSGPNIGEAGTVVRYVAKSKLADKVLKPVTDQLAASGHVGYVDVNCIIDDDGNPWPLEFTMREGFPTFDIQQAIHEGDPAEWLVALASGQKEKPPFMLDTVSLGIAVMLPYNSEKVGVPVYGITEKNSDSIHPCDMMLGEAPVEIDGKIESQPMMVSAGDFLLVCTGTGQTVREAKTAAYKTVESLVIPANPTWRNNVGQRLSHQLPKLQAMGYATALSY